MFPLVAASGKSVPAALRRQPNQAHEMCSASSACLPCIWRVSLSCENGSEKNCPLSPIACSIERRLPIHHCKRAILQIAPNFCESAKRFQIGKLKRKESNINSDQLRNTVIMIDLVCHPS